jgi:diadenosine tetraphosphatase ApaH/serine/threonine PP2A family protein phosphatase
LRLWLRHASPWDEETYLYPDSSRLQDVRLDPDTFLVVGHTHHPLRYDINAGALVNPGSVGQPRDWNPSASFATLYTESREIDFHRVSYNVCLVQEQLRRQNWPESSISILSRQRK